jgi:predicted RNA polymerase sigma factor
VASGGVAVVIRSMPLSLIRKDVRCLRRTFLAAVDHVEDDVLRLMFVCCHPVLTAEAQCTLTLKLVGGLTTRRLRARI